jgi:hypothetical protein
MITLISELAVAEAGPRQLMLGLELTIWDYQDSLSSGEISVIDTIEDMVKGVNNSHWICCAESDLPGFCTPFGHGLLDQIQIRLWSDTGLGPAGNDSHGCPMAPGDLGVLVGLSKILRTFQI